MTQLTGVDEAWFALESETTPMHITCIDIFEPAEGDKAEVSLTALKSEIEKKVDTLQLRLKVKKPFLSMDHRHWVNDDGFDLSNHIFHKQLPDDSSQDQFLKFITKIGESVLDRSKPLWEIHVISNIEVTGEYKEGSFALVTKLHHAQYDGGSLMRFFDILYSDAGADEAAGFTGEFPLDSELTPWSMLKIATKNSIAKPVKLTRSLSNVLKSIDFKQDRKGKVEKAARKPKTTN